MNDLGGYCPQFDRPEQLLDLAQEAMTALELTPGEDVFIGINCAAQEFFDMVMNILLFVYLKALDTIGKYSK